VIAGHFLLGSRLLQGAEGVDDHAGRCPGYGTENETQSAQAAHPQEDSQNHHHPQKQRELHGSAHELAEEHHGPGASEMKGRNNTEDQENEDHLFALKLAIFEIDAVKESVDMDKKKLVRQSKTKSDLVYNALSIILKK